jgi:hypothetical protein
MNLKDAEEIVTSLDKAGLLAPPVDGVEVKEQAVKNLQELHKSKSKLNLGVSE